MCKVSCIIKSPKVNLTAFYLWSCFIRISHHSSEQTQLVQNLSDEIVFYMVYRHSHQDLFVPCNLEHSLTTDLHGGAKTI